MGASNFSRPNASAIFAVFMDREEGIKTCDNCGTEHRSYEYDLEKLTTCVDCGQAGFTEEVQYTSVEMDEIEDELDYLKEQISEKAGHFYFKDLKSTDDMFYLQFDKDFGDVNIEVKVYGTIESGYHEGAQLDWRLEFNGDDEELNFESQFDYNSDMPKGMQVIQRRNAEKWAEKVKTEMIIIIEEVYTDFSIPLKRVATFSNGESIYEKIEK